MTTPTAHPELPASLYRSEAFAEDLDDLLPGLGPSERTLRRLPRMAWMLGLPLALLLLGSASALAWA